MILKFGGKGWMKNNRLVSLQREEIEKLESELKHIKKENELFKNYNERLEEKIESMRKAHKDAMDEYQSALCDMSVYRDKVIDMINETIEANKERRKQFRILMKDVKKDTKNINTLCSICNKEIGEDYVFSNGCYFCTDCWDHKAD